jgi:ribosome modulation factor
MAELQMPEGTNVSPVQYQGWMEEYEGIDREIREAVGQRKDLRSRIRAAGVPLAAFDRARKDSDVAASVREHEDTWYRTFLAWEGKGVSVGGQASLELDMTDDAVASMYAQRLRQAETDGHAAGAAGRGGDDCSWPSGSEGAQRWHAGWQEGQRGLAEKLETTPPRRAGRPPGSKNKPKPEAVTRVGRGARGGRGRGRGSQRTGNGQLASDL